MSLLQFWPEPIRAAAETPVAGKHGLKPKMRGEIAAKMFGDVRERQRIPDDLTNDTLIALLARYGGSPSTAKAARRDSL